MEECEGIEIFICSDAEDDDERCDLSSLEDDAGLLNVSARNTATTNALFKIKFSQYFLSFPVVRTVSCEQDGIG